jgi:hypothetical protein
VLVAGGNWIWAEDPYMAPQGEIYDPWLDTWTLTPAMPHYVLTNSAAVLLSSGDVLLTGGNIFSPFLLYEHSITAAQVFNGETHSPAARQ